ncbi:MAG: hypothetical protein ACOZAN_00945 [Patescibacteria group bacterium]
MPPISDLFKESWEALKKSWKNLLLAEVIAFLGIFALIIMMFAFFFGSGVLAGITSPGIANNPEEILSLINPGTIGVTALLLGSFIFFAFFMQMAFSSTLIASVYQADENPSFGKVLGHGFRTAVPMLLTGLLTGVIVLGGYGLLLIPGIIISIFLAFSLYEVSTQGRNLFEAMKESYNIVSNNFWEIVVRGVLVFIIGLFASYVPAIMAESINMSESGIFVLLNMIISIFVSFYSLSYMVVLYKHARNATPVGQNKNMAWMYVVSAIGWVVLVLVGAAVYQGIGEAIETMNNDLGVRSDFKKSFEAGQRRRELNEQDYLMDDVNTRFEESEENFYQFEQDVQE